MTRRFRIGDRDINFIAELSLNINHLVRPSVLYAHLHEVGHMVSELIGGGLAGPSRACSTDAACSYAGIANCFTVTDRANKAAHEPTDTDQLNARRERYEEIFAEMFGYGLVFADYVEGQGDGSFMAYRSAPGHRNLRTFMRFSTAMYFLDPVSTTGEPARVLLKLSEVLTRFFLAAYPFTHPMRQDGSKKPLYESGDGLDSYEPSSADLRKASHLFHEAVADAGPFLPHYQRFREVPEAQDYLAEHFRKAFTSSYRPVRCIWGHVSRILQSVFFDWKKSNWAGGIGTNPCPKDHWALVRELKKGYRQGRPAIRLLYDDPRSDSVYLTAGGEECNYRMEDMEKRTHADALFVVRHLLRIHVSEVFDRMDVAKQVCLLRGSESTEDVNSQLVDRFFGGLFCTDFSKRKDYLRGRIALIKTLSDLSMNIRGRTFRRILAQFAHDSFPDRFDPPRDS